jgi:hypothetical protein
MGSKKPSVAEKEASKKTAIRGLKKMLKPGSTLYSVLRHRSPSRLVGVVAYLVIRKGKVINISANIADALGHYKWDDRDGIWTNSEFTPIHQLSQQLHGLENVGAVSNMQWDGIPTPKRYSTGYSIIHKQL